MNLLAPVEITPRLEAGLRIPTNDGTAWLGVHAIIFDGRRSTFKWTLDGPSGEVIGSEESLSVCGRFSDFSTVHDALVTLLVFMDASTTDSTVPLPTPVQEFSKKNLDTIQNLLTDLEAQGEAKI